MPKQNRFSAMGSSELVSVANQYRANLLLKVEQGYINLKSLMSVFAADLREGEPASLVADGADEKEAFEALDKWFTK